MSASNGLTEPKSSLPTFTSIHDRPAREYSYESSNASSRRSAAHSQTRNNHGDELRESPNPNVREGPGHRGSGLGFAGGTVKRLKRSSGGFLLDSRPSSVRLSRSLLARQSVKGKEKPDDPPLSLLRTTNPPDGRASTSSFRGSLQSSGVQSSPADHNHASSSHHSSKNAVDKQNQNGSIHSHRSSTPGQNVPLFGFDTDPAQIVDMALRLNEGRRRQIVAKRFVSSGNHGKRVVSNATSLSPKSPIPNSNIPNGSLRAVAKPKHLTRTPEPTTPQRNNREFEVHTVETSPNVMDGFSPEQDDEEVNQSMQISRATQNRVAKAKAYFELAYQHRRLLSHLPPIRQPHLKFNPDQPGFGSRAYNPLQYARNRKLRFRERRPINSEADGWYDVDKVRTWVDAVVSSHPSTSHDPLQCVRLPPLNLIENEEAQDPDSDEDSDTRQRRRPGKPRRPKSDWITYPGDLIADAFWTEQGLNKKKIYSRDNEPIYPPDTEFLFSGWRNRVALNVPEELKSSSPEISPRTNKKAVVSPPDLPHFESAHRDHSWARTKPKFGKTLKKSRKGKKEKGENEIFDASDSSDSGTSVDDETEDRGRKRVGNGSNEFALPDGDPFTGPVQTAERADSAKKSSEVDLPTQNAPRNSMDRASLLRYLQRSNTSATNFTDGTDKTKPSKRRTLLETIRLDPEYAGRSSFEYDSTAPGTPIVDGFPSIAINLSPPNSRTPSPSGKGSTSFLDVVKDKALNTINTREQKDHIDRTDFAHVVSHRSSRSRSSFSRSKRSRGTSPVSRGVSPVTRQPASAPIGESSVVPIDQQTSNTNKASSRTTDSHRRHRVRGVFKGGRLAELVGNEVSRVGGFIRKRELPKPNVAESGSISGYETESDQFSDYGESLGKKSQNRNPRGSIPNSQASARSVSPGSRSTKFPSTSAQPYHIQGLPSFTSPFQRDREAHEAKAEPENSDGMAKSEASESEVDPVSTGVAASRAGKSPRFDQLAPPKLDITSTTPDGRRDSYGFGLALDLSRTVSASQLYNSAVNGEPSKPRESIRLSSMAVPSRFFNVPEDTSPNDLTLTQTRSSTNVKHVTIQDYARLRGLLASVAVKATNITAYCDEIPQPQSAFLISSFETTKASRSEINKHLPVPRKQEHVVAARHLIDHLNHQSKEFNDHLTKFTSVTTVGLQRGIQILEDKTESSLFPRLQRLSDEVGELAQKLTTTSTLAVRSVNDGVVEAVRLKRRGPYRFGRALWFKLIEWGVVGLLWGIWFVVMIIRLAVGTVRGIWAILAWLFWLR